MEWLHHIIDVFTTLPNYFLSEPFSIPTSNTSSPMSGMVSSLFNFSHFSGCVIKSSYSFLWIFLRTTYVEHLFVCLFLLWWGVCSNLLTIFCIYPTWSFLQFGACHWFWRVSVIISPALFLSPLGIPSCVCHVPFENFLQFLDVPKGFFPFLFYFFAFQFEKFLLAYYQVYWVFPWHVRSTTEPIRAFFISWMIWKISSIFIHVATISSALYSFG